MNGSSLSSQAKTKLLLPIPYDSVDVLSGVPSESVFSPHIFLILMEHINSDIIFATLRSFADNTRISKGIKSIYDSTHLQADLDTVYKWTFDNNVSFIKSAKFELIRYMQLK